MCHNSVPLADASVFEGVVLPVVTDLLLTHHPHDCPGLVQVSDTVVAHPLRHVVAYPLRHVVAHPLRHVVAHPLRHVVAHPLRKVVDVGDSGVAGTALPEDSATVDLAGFCCWI